MGKNKVEITLAGQNYTVLSEESPSYIRKLADGINKRISAAMKSSDRITLNEAFVLTVMDFADELKKSEEQTKKLKDEIADYLQDAENAKTERDKYLHELSHLKKS